MTCAGLSAYNDNFHVYFISIQRNVSLPFFPSLSTVGKSQLVIFECGKVMEEFLSLVFPCMKHT
jgi:hypothetical protein